NQRLAAVAEEMGVVLGRTAVSPNIKERRDFSCAVFDARGALVAQAAHIPVHLGSTALSVRAAIAGVPLGPGDVAMLNDPFAGGTHLPDVTVVAPVFLRGRRRPFAYVANRAHHADVGADRLRALVARVGGVGRLARQMAALQAYSAALMHANLARIPRGVYRARDVLDDDGLGTENIPITVAIGVGGGRARIDFSGSAPQVRGPVNANFAVTRSAVLYVFTALAPEPIPPNEGLAWPLRI